MLGDSAGQALAHCSQHSALRGAITANYNLFTYLCDNKLSGSAAWRKARGKQNDNLVGQSGAGKWVPSSLRL